MIHIGETAPGLDEVCITSFTLKPDCRTLLIRSPRFIKDLSFPVGYIFTV
jgi:hypothetical protein